MRVAHVSAAKRITAGRRNGEEDVVFATPERCACCSGRGVGVSPLHLGMCLGTQLVFSPCGSQHSLSDKETQFSRFHDM